MSVAGVVAWAVRGACRVVLAVVDRIDPPEPPVRVTAVRGPKVFTPDEFEAKLLAAFRNAQRKGRL